MKSVAHRLRLVGISFFIRFSVGPRIEKPTGFRVFERIVRISPALSSFLIVSIAAADPSSGVPPLSCQWLFDGTALPGATQGVLTLTNVQASQAGNYVLQVSSPCGSASSKPVRLGIWPAPIGRCTPAPPGLIGWWRAEGDVTDSVGTNNGTMQHVRFVNGVVGQAFAFDPDSFPCGTYCGVDIPDRPAYALTNALSIEGWIRPRGNGYTIF